MRQSTTGNARTRNPITSLRRAPILITRIARLYVSVGVIGRPTIITAYADLRVQSASFALRFITSGFLPFVTFSLHMRFDPPKNANLDSFAQTFYHITFMKFFIKHAATFVMLANAGSDNLSHIGSKISLLYLVTHYQETRPRLFIRSFFSHSIKHL